ncbi:hypothetical protein GCM10022240_13070 [Microbacterium kribbense]|uniref:Glycosyl/glycerophosphate transferase n=1 Tax=Microbacterium kribbense TaxID=433645 RepID=A0ABP7GDK2_9MICO
MTDARFETHPAPALVLTGTGPRPQRVDLVGARAVVTARLTGRGKTWRAVVPLRAARWGGPLLPLPTGDYDVHIEPGAAGDPVELTAALPVTVLGDLRASLGDGRVQIGPPTDPVYDSWEAQAALERRYATRPSAQLENAVFFESFYGRNASDNPLAIDRELARVAPEVTRYWSVVDLSVPVPPGAVPIVEGSPQWWRARGAARLLVVNDWLRRRYERRRGQHVIQTWHGTPLKRLALHRHGFDLRRAFAVVRESRRWDVLLAQNPYAAGILSRAYAFGRRPIWVEGYPRNDVLVGGDGAAARARLGIGTGERVLLYAPTWRDDREQIVDFLDLEALARQTGAVVLVRGHSRTLAPGRDAAGARVIDVTAFGDTAQLMLAADILITDYSSVMFDFSVTGKPIFFLVPDIDHYRGDLRGFYFDLAAHAPGPLVQTQEQLVAAIADHDPARFATDYARWRDRFNAREDGHAAERVLARILDQGLIAR